MKMYNVGRKGSGCEPISEKEIYYPTLDISSEKIPELEKRKIGGNVKLSVEGVIKGMRKDKKGSNYEVEVRKCGVVKHIMNKEEYMKMSNNEKDEYDEKSY